MSVGQFDCWLLKRSIDVLIGRRGPVTITVCHTLSLLLSLLLSLERAALTPSQQSKNHNVSVGIMDSCDL